MLIQPQLQARLRQAGQIWLLLDYDGTLAEFAPTPDDIFPDDELIELIRASARLPRTRVGVISGRRLAHIEKLLPIDDIWSAGSYGLEMRLPGGENLHRIPYAHVRPELERLKPVWAALVDPGQGFYLEDKGWSLAIHARFVDDRLAEETLRQARHLAEAQLDPQLFALLGGHKFLEAAPHAADKGQSITYLLERFGSANTFPIYLGDDDKDERAYPVVQAYGGIAGCICGPERPTAADFRLASPLATRAWLRALIGIIQGCA